MIDTVLLCFFVFHFVLMYSTVRLSSFLFIVCYSAHTLIDYRIVFLWGVVWGGGHATCRVFDSNCESLL
jgi:hypothetical protein